MNYAIVFSGIAIKKIMGEAQVLKIVESDNKQII